VVEDGPECVAGVLTGRGVLDRLADRDPEGSGGVGIRGEDRSSGVGVPLGDGTTFAPQVSMSMRRYGFWL